MSAELIKAQREQIEMLKELIEHKDNMIAIYKEHVEVVQQQFDNAIKILDESIKINKQLSEKTTTD